MKRSHSALFSKQTVTSNDTLGFSLIIEKVNEVRRRLKRIKVTRGLAFFLGISLPVWALAVLTVDHWNYARPILTFSRIVSLLILCLLFAYFLLRPLFEQIKEQRVARYIEERHPELKDRLVSVIEFSRNDAGGEPSNPFFPLLLRDALESCREIETRFMFSRKASWIPASLAGVLVFGFAAALFFGPHFLHYATLKLYLPWWLEKTPPLYGIQVKPGTVDLPKGSELLVTARLIGLDRPEVFLFSRHESSPDWEKRRMEPEKGSNVFKFLFLDVNDDLRYYVRSGTIQSEEFSITTLEHSRVQQIDVTYHYPAYTALPEHVEEDAAEIAAIKGTNVTLSIRLSSEVPAGKILLQDGTQLLLSKKGSRLLEGSFQLWKDSSYRIQLLDQGLNFLTASNEYPIRVLDDRPPFVSFLKPGRDKKVTQLEEVLTETKAEDDFGIRSLDLHFSVNGGKENVVSLFGSSPSRHRPLDSGAEIIIDHSKGGIPTGIKSSRSMTATHTFFLEEYQLEPGDLISYFATASDSRSVTSSDIYFLEVRPFGKQYSQRQVSDGLETDAAATDAVLSIRQKEILAATWRLIRDHKTFSEDEYGSNLKLVAAQQYKLQQQTQSLSERIQRRALTNRDKDIQKLSENLIKAIESMSPARLFLSAGKPAEAVSPEQISLQFLLRAEAFYKQVQVAYGKMSAAQAESLGAQELENLFELELDKLKNQYETQKQPGSNSSKKELDEALQELKELARRQQQLLANKKKQFGTHITHSANSIDSDPQTIEQEAQKLARQLERLSRESQDPALDRASQQMRQATQDLRASGGNSPGQGSENRGLEALSRMYEVQQLLDHKINGSLAKDVGRLKNNAQNLKNRQEHLQQALDSLEKQSATKQTEPSVSGGNKLAERPSQEKQQILQEKYELAQSVSGMEQELRDTALKAANDQKALSQKLQAAANFIRENRLEESLRQGSRLISRDLFELAQQTEKHNLQTMNDLQQRLESAEKSLAPDQEASRKNRLSEALNRTDDLVEELKSLSSRIHEIQLASTRQTTTPRSSGNKGGEGRETSSHSGQNQSKPRPAVEESPISHSRTGGESIQRTPWQSSNGDSKNRNEASGEQIRFNGQETQVSREESRVKGTEEAENLSRGDNEHRNAAVNFGDYQLPPPLPLSDESLKQFEREFALRIQEAHDLSRHLRGEAELDTQLKNMINQMQQMGSLKFVSDARELDKLKSSIIGGFQELELQLSKDLQTMLMKDCIRFAKEDDVPLLYRNPVEEYYKALSRK